MMVRVLLVILAGVLCGAAWRMSHRGIGQRTTECPAPGLCVRTVRHGGAAYEVGQIDTLQHPVLLSAPPGGTTLQEVDDRLSARAQAMGLGMNAGMFEPDFSMVGLAVEGGKVHQRVNQRRGAGNFYTRPNGIFYTDADGPHVVTTQDFAQRGLEGVTTATQSGPMLLLRSGGAAHPAIHPDITAGSQSAHTRNAVGVKGRTVFMVISNDEVNLHSLAVMMREALGCEAALYLDGTVSALKAGGIEIGGVERRFGGVLYVPVKQGRD